MLTERDRLLARRVYLLADLNRVEAQIARLPRPRWRARRSVPTGRVWPLDELGLVDGIDLEATLDNL